MGKELPLDVFLSFLLDFEEQDGGIFLMQLAIHFENLFRIPLCRHGLLL